MNDIVKNVPYSNPSLLPIGNYDIDIRDIIDIDLPNMGEYGRKKEGKWSIIDRFIDDDGKEYIIVNLVTLKKVLDKLNKYPKMKKSETASLTSLCLVDGNINIKGDIVKISKSK